MYIRVISTYEYICHLRLYHTSPSVAVVSGIVHLVDPRSCFWIKLLCRKERWSCEARTAQDCLGHDATMFQTVNPVIGQIVEKNMVPAWLRTPGNLHLVMDMQFPNHWEFPYFLHASFFKGFQKRL